jgi:proteasome lid subunit RPN8/RPN11
MVPPFHMRRHVIEAIRAHAREEDPDECCGLLLGTGNLADRAVRCRNLLASPTRFQLDPADHIAAIRAVRGTPQSIVGVYHSHPRAAPVPSRTDLEEAAYPEYVYCIVSLLDDRAAEDLRAYRLDHGNFVAVEIVSLA